MFAGMRTNICISLALTVAACGGASDPLPAVPSASTPIALRVGTGSPGCFEGRTEASPTSDRISAQNQFREFQRSFDLQAMQLVARPILEDPSARRWALRTPRVAYDGAVVARGNDWAVVKMVVSIENQRTYDVEVHALPDQTRYEFQDSTLVVATHWESYDDDILGCDPETGVSFEGYDEIDEDGARRRVTRCWPDPPQPDPTFDENGHASGPVVSCSSIVDAVVSM